LTLDTNLNQFPYFDNFNSANQYYRVLYKPSAAVQARELTTSQSILQNQIEEFGDNIFTNGTIIKGCNITFDTALPYVKLQDNYANGAALTVSSLNGFFLVSNSGLKAIVQNSTQGYVAASPNLNTLYIKYLNSATNTSIKVFQNDEILSVVTSANVSLGNITVANTISSGSSNTTGYGYGVKVDGGIIFQKGLMLNVNSQELIISPFNNVPDNISVGFQSTETIVTAYQDPSLFDNAQGSPNYNAPGADRLKIVPTLVAVSSTGATALSNTFFSIVDFVAGAPSIINQDTQYATIGAKMAQYSSDTNGNFIISPFNVRTIESVLANGTIDSQNMRLEVDSGKAYINGYKVNITGKVLSVLQKGTNVNYGVSQILTTQYGNYVPVQEVAGIIDPTIVQTVNLQNAAAYGVSNNLAKGIATNSISPPGSKIGTANIIVFRYVSGQPSQANAQYYAYLFNVQMTNNNTFGSVRSIYANNATVIGVADIVLTNNTAVIQNPNFAPMVYGFNQQAIKTLKTQSNTVDTQFQYRASTTVNISNTGTATISLPTYTGGTNELPYGTGNLATSRNDFTVIAESTVHTANIVGSVVTSASSNVVTGTSTVFNTALYAGSLITVANSTATETKQVATITNATSLTTTVPFTSTFSTGNAYITYLAGEVIPLVASNTTISVINSSAFSITLPAAVNTAFNALVQYNALRIASNPAKKDLQTSVWVKIDCSNNAGGTTGPWCLGIPDVYSILNVYAGTTYSLSNPVETSNYSLVNNERDQYYGLSTLSSNGAILSSSNKLLVQLQCFVRDVSAGEGFFSVDSYPVDDTGATANSIYTQDIPIYTSIAGQESFQLRNSVDFRIYTSNTIPFVSNGTLAVSNTLIINPANTISFVTSNMLLPVPDAAFESSLQYYMGRYDTVGLSNTGQIIINTGIPSENPIPPGDVSAGMTLATIYIPPYPTLTPDIVDYNENANTPTTSLVYRQNKRYTMADIGGLDSRLSQVEYYTSLSVLEQSAQNLLLTNASGSNRFQNGILADPMSDFSIANTTDPSFNIAIDSVSSQARPTFSQYLVNLINTPNANDNVQSSTNGRLILLNYSQFATPFLSQPFASQERNCAQDTLYVWNGIVTLNPEGDYQPDVTTNPDVVVSLDSYSNWSTLANAWGTQWGTWNEVSNTVTTASATATTSTTTTTSSANGIQLSVSQDNNNYTFGDSITNISLQPYVRANLLQYSAYGLKPSTLFNAYFNDVNVTNYCSSTNSTFGSANSQLISDSNGNLQGFFAIPAETFYTGTINFQLIDVTNLTTQNNIITSVASTTYFGTNLSYTQNALDLDTTSAQLAITTVSQTLSTTNSIITPTPITVVPAAVSPPSVTVPATSPSVIVPATVYVTPSVAANPTTTSNTNYYLSDGAYSEGYSTGVSTTSGNGTNGRGLANPSTYGGGSGDHGGGDPIAQSFTVLSSQLPTNVQGVYLTSMDLFFATKDASLGITIQIQTMENGTLTPEIVPFSQIHLLPSQINTSTNGSTATNVSFNAPVFLENGSNYAFVCIPDGSNPNYNVFTAVIGGKDIITGAPIFSLSGYGEMFMSSQGYTWTPYQNESIKFNLYVAAFTASSGVAVFNNDNYEYLTISNTVSNFQLGENVYFANDVLANGTANVVNTSAVITGFANTTGYNNGATIIISSTLNQTSCIRTIVNVVNSTAITANSNTAFTDTGATVSYINFGVYGKVKTVNTSFMTVSNSSATNGVGYYLSGNNITVFGLTSGAFAPATLVDMPYDTLMPKFSTSIPTVSTLSISMTGTSNSSTSYTADSNTTLLTFGQSTDFLDKERVVMSKSNEYHYSSGKKSLTISANYNTTSPFLSPAIDMIKAGSVLVYNLVNADDANSDVFTSEITNSGNAINKYISTTVTLAPGLEAEDLVVYLGAYYPPNTNIYVYAKLLNQYDTDTFQSKSWTPMFSNNTARSSLVNVQDFNEYIFNFPTVNTAPYTAYLDTTNNNVVAYTSPESNVYETFNVFAVKIVLLSSSSQNVPRITDLRAIASASIS
jgi:hypothetical protein